MKHFRLIASDIDISSIRTFLNQHPELWTGWAYRQETPTVHGVKARLLGNPNLSWREAWKEGVREGLFLRWLFGSGAPDINSAAEWARDTLKAIAALTGATEIGRICLAKLQPGGRIPPHTDEGPYIERFPYRFHCTITSNAACWFECGGERVRMAAGELWWFNQKVKHQVLNQGNTDRIHLLFDTKLASALL